MSPRSEEFFATAVRRLASARLILTEDPAAALVMAYYAALYAARAALSERDTYARTHGGIWGELHRLFVAEGLLPAEVAAAVARLQQPREQADYEAAEIPANEAEAAIDAAQAFVDAVADVLDAG